MARRLHHHGKVPRHRGGVFLGGDAGGAIFPIGIGGCGRRRGQGGCQRGRAVALGGLEDRGWRRGCRHRGELREQVEERVAVDVAYTAADAVAVAPRGDAREGEMRSQQEGIICIVEVFTADGGVVKVVATRLAVRHAHDAEGVAAAAAHGALAAEAQRELGRAAVEAAGPQRPGRSTIEVT